MSIDEFLHENSQRYYRREYTPTFYKFPGSEKRHALFTEMDMINAMSINWYLRDKPTGDLQPGVYSSNIPVRDQVLWLPEQMTFLYFKAPDVIARMIINLETGNYQITGFHFGDGVEIPKHWQEYLACLERSTNETV